ncbi:hypothetical protein ACFO3J_33455 [Streptomyces polygonati]|uniref:Uncharacterized protein n=1 Tax=Streptomyces polygonati TaxID=1617087 RepID=A0ABV8HW64_9ACTN
MPDTVRDFDVLPGHLEASFAGMVLPGGCGVRRPLAGLRTGRLRPT